MSKKRTSAESSRDEQVNEGSDSFQQEDNAKHAKLISLSDTTLQDLPNELLGPILVRAVVMEVKGMKLAKCVWKVKADLVMIRLRTVCSRWSIILTTNFFRNEVHRILDSTAQETIRLEIVNTAPIDMGFTSVTVMRDEVYELRRECGQFVIKVTNNNRAVSARTTIALPSLHPEMIAGCSTSDCVYILVKEPTCIAVFVVRRQGGNQFSISPWLTDLMLLRSVISVDRNGHLTILSNQDNPKITYVSIYNANGSLGDNITLTLDRYGFSSVNSAAQRANGNVVVAADTTQKHSVLVELDSDGALVRRFHQVLRPGTCVCFLDDVERVIIPGNSNNFIILDFEFNVLWSTDPCLPGDKLSFPPVVSYNQFRNEFVTRRMIINGGITVVLLTFRIEIQ